MMENTIDDAWTRRIMAIRDSALGAEDARLRVSHSRVARFSSAIGAGGHLVPADVADEFARYLGIHGPAPVPNEIAGKGRKRRRNHRRMENMSRVFVRGDLATGFIDMLHAGPSPMVAITKAIEADVDRKILASVNDFVEGEPTHSFKCTKCGGWFSTSGGKRVPCILWGTPGALCACADPQRAPLKPGDTISIMREIDWGTSYD